jgi:hypothetical protein
MPRFHFNVRDGSDLRDRDGTELPDLRTARREAVKLAGRLLLDEPDREPPLSRLDRRPYPAPAE